MVYYIVTSAYVLSCFLLVLVVLLQQGKGGGIAGAFGGGSSQTAFGARTGATVLSRATSVLAVLFMVGAILIAILRQGGGTSVIGGREPQQSAPASVPVDSPTETVP